MRKKYCNSVNKFAYLITFRCIYMSTEVVFILRLSGCLGNPTIYTEKVVSNVKPIFYLVGTSF